MFDSIYSTSVTATEFLIMAVSALVSGLLFSWIMSFKIKAQSRFFVVTTILPFVVAVIVTFVKGSIGAGLALAGGTFGLIRFRSAQSSSDELVAVLIAMASGVAFGMGYVTYGVLLLAGLAAVFMLLSMMKIFNHKSMTKDKLLNITIPESLEYVGAFDDTFTHYLKSYESVGVKTTGMGSMYKLSFKIQMKNPGEEKAFIDELRTKNGNLEIAMLPYADVNPQL